MPKRKQARRVTMRDIRSILRLTFDQDLSVRAVSDRLKLSKTTVATYLLRAREAGLACWPLPAGSDDDSVLGSALFQRAGRPPRDSCQQDWAYVAAEMKRDADAVVAGISVRTSGGLWLHMVLRSVSSISEADQCQFPQPA
jgi:hypothetical protein